MQIEKLMSRRASSCGRAATLAEAARTMEETRVGALAVVDDRGLVVGVITDRDIALAAGRATRPLAEVTVETAMTDRVIVCSATDDAKDALHAMIDHRIRRVPVVDADGRLVGMLSLDDLAHAARDGGMLSSVNAKDVVRALASLSRRDEVDADDVLPSD